MTRYEVQTAVERQVRAPLHLSVRARAAVRPGLAGRGERRYLCLVSTRILWTDDSVPGQFSVADGSNASEDGGINTDMREEVGGDVRGRLWPHIKPTLLRLGRNLYLALR